MMGNTTTSRLVLEGASFGLLRSSGTARPGERRVLNLVGFTELMGALAA
jgi:hypothetical protein